MVKDVSEGGMRFHLINPVAVGQILHFAMNIDVARRLEGRAQMVWTAPGGKSGGMSFVELSAESRETLRAWLAEIDSPGTASPVASIRTTSQARPAASPTDTISAAPVPSAAAPVMHAPVGSPPPPSPSPLNTPSTMTSAILAPTPTSPAALPDYIPSTPTSSPTSSSSLVAATLTVAEPLPSPAVDSTSVAVAAPEPTPPLLDALPPSVVPETVSPEIPPRVPIEVPAEVSAPAAQAATESSVGPPESSRPVTREDWIRAARENFVPGERSSRSAASLIAGKISAPADEEKPRFVFLPGHAEAKRPAGKKYEKIAASVDPLREFLRQPLDDSSPLQAAAEENGAILAESPRNVWPISRVAMVLALAAICGVAAAVAAIAYRQTLGESIIQLGEKISGEPRSQVNDGAPKYQPAESSPGQPIVSAKPPVKGPPPKGVNATAPASPAAQPAVTPNSNSPISQTHPQTLQQLPTPQAELASGRELIPGKPRRAEDVSSLWLAVENGDAAAEIQLANHYAAGDGVEKNCDQARVLLQAAAKRGSELATKRLAALSSDGCQQ
jgi:hypothetical protein